MKQLIGGGIAVLFILIVLASGCLTGSTSAVDSISDAQQEKTELKADCNDNNKCTKDYYNELTGDCEFTIIDDCCGNGICEPDERCNEDTHLTNCVEDCTRTCPHYLIVHKTETGKESDTFAMSCADTNCEQISENRYMIPDSSGVKTIITNIGERSAPIISASFICQSDDIQANENGEDIKGVVFEGYFDDNEEYAKGLNAIQSGSNSAIYYLMFDTTNIEERFTANCKVMLRTTDFRNEQEFKLSFV